MRDKGVMRWVAQGRGGKRTARAGALLTEGGNRGWPGDVMSPVPVAVMRNSS